MRDSQGDLRAVALLVLYALPLAAAVFAFGFGAIISASALLPGATMITATTFALVTLTFNRVKDATASERPAVGPDPVERAYRSFRIVLSSAATSLTCSGLLIAMILFNTTPLIGRLASACVIAMLLHLGVRLWHVLIAIRSQAEAIAQDRIVPAIPTARPKLVVNK
ncbi:hypothetical protein ABZU78_25435 [Rhodococcus erythropolis]|uniref:hypothetical protein n=1 Tax=Rhodococcus erythropolis TaxID=1833 RepID=UPI0033A037F9